MLSILVAAHVADGHMAPMLTIAGHLAGQGHRVRFLAGDRFADAVSRTGAEFLPWADDAMVDHELARTGDTGMKALADNVERIFIAPGAGQYRDIVAAIAAEHTDVVLTEFTVVGAACLAWGVGEHPPVVACGILPLGLTSIDTAPWGLGILPQPGVFGRTRNQLLNWLTRHVVLRRPQRLTTAVVKDLVGADFTVFFLDWAVRADLYAQLTVPGFEYPRSDLSPNVRFVGPLIGARTREVALPGWWGDLDDRVVVHVSQGTVATDPAELILPTMRALANRDVLVVASTGGAPVDRLGELPANARAAEFIPYDELMPKVDVFVSNGGYGGLHFALAHGVPMVVAGNTEDKAETTRRVEWSGVGINLETQMPSEAAIADAVDRVLSDPSFRERARVLRDEIAVAPGLDGLADLIVAVAQKA